MLPLKRIVSTLFLSVILALTATGQKLDQQVTAFQESYYAGNILEARAQAPALLEKAEKKWKNEPAKHADLLNTVGQIYYSLAIYDTAKAYYWTAMEMVKPVLGESSFDYAAYGFNLAQCFQEEGDFAQSESWLRYTLPILAEGYGQNSLEYTQCFHQLALLYTEMGRYQEAMPMSEAAVYYYKEILGEDHADYQLAYNNLARIYQGVGRYAEAEQIFVWCLEKLRPQAAENGVNYYVTLNNLAELYRVTGNYEEALPLYQEAIPLATKYKAEDPTGLATLYNNRGLLNKALGQFHDSEQDFNASLAEYKSLGMENHPWYTNPLNNIGDLYRTMGRYDEAIEATVEVIEKRKALIGEMQPRYANAVNNLGLIYTDIEAFEEAENALSTALSIYEETLGKEHKDYANCLNNLGTVLAAQGEFEKSCELFQQALDHFRTSLGEEHEDFAIYLSTLGEVRGMMGEHEKAIAHLEKALGITERKLGVNSPNHLDIRFKLAQAYRLAKLDDKAIPLFIESLQAQLKQIHDFFPVMDEAERTAYYMTVSYRFELFISYLHDYSLTGREIPSALRQQWYDFQLATKGILLNEQNQVRRKITESGDSELISLHQQWLNARATLLYAYRMSESERNAADVDLNQIENEAKRLEKELNQRTSLLSESNRHVGKTWVDVQAELQSDEVAIEIVRSGYYSTRYTDTVLYYALVVKPGAKAPIAIALNDGKQLETQALAAYRASISDGELTGDSYQDFWAPIAAVLGAKTKTAYIATDGVYQQINLYTLFDPKAGANLVHALQIDLLISTRDLMTRRKAESFPEDATAVLVGFPDYNLGMDIEQGNYSRTGLRKVQALPGTKAEVEAIADVLNDSRWQTDLRLGKEATEGTVKQLRNPTILHIATHGFFLESKARKSKKTLGIDSEQSRWNPMLRSGLLLAGVSAPATANQSFQGNEDGILTAYEASDLRLDQTELVVLSACETGLGDVVNGEGVYGLQRAFQVAGAKSMIMSLWEVGDEATQALMTTFYELWLKNPEAGKQEAFRNAQRQLMNDFPDPYFWGAFILIN